MGCDPGAHEVRARMRRARLHHRLQRLLFENVNGLVRRALASKLMLFAGSSAVALAHCVAAESTEIAGLTHGLCHTGPYHW